MDKVWLVTGSASGLGRNIAEAVLESGDRLVATARDPKRVDDLVNKYGDRVRAVPLDVTDESAAQAAVQTAVAAFGGGARANQDTPELLPDYEPSIGAVASAPTGVRKRPVSGKSDPGRDRQIMVAWSLSGRQRPRMSPRPTAARHDRPLTGRRSRRQLHPLDRPQLISPLPARVPSLATATQALRI